MDICELVLISSEGCNLNCTYCEVTKPQQKVNNEKIQEAFKNGEYLNNIIKTVKTLNGDINNITAIQLWGQEPTLTMIEFADFFPSLYNYFPKINKISFSTNGVEYMDRILYLVKIINNTIPKDTPFEISIQFSHDGTYSTENYRQTSSQNIINNLKNLINKLNETVMPPCLVVNIHAHGVLNREIMREFVDKDDKLLEYWVEWRDYTKELKNLCLYNPQVNFLGWLPSLVTPINASKEEGQLLHNFYKNSIQAFKKNNIPNGIVNTIITEFTHNLLKPDFLDSKVGTNINNIIYKLINYNFDDSKKIEYLSKAVFCGAFFKVVKVRYDGSLVHCQNTIHLLTEENCNNFKGQEYLTAKQKVKHNHYPNIAKEGLTPENQKIFDTMTTFGESGYPQLYTSIVNVMKVLLDAHQIDESYKDNSKLLRHAFLLSWFNNCIDSEYRANGSAITKHLGFIRLHCNGFLDDVENYCLQYKSREDK